VSQVTSLLKFAKETTNPQLAAVLIEKAADLKSQVDESSTTPDSSPRAPDVDPETKSPATSSPQAEFLKGCRHKRPYTFHRIALLWSNRAGVWQINDLT